MAKFFTHLKRQNEQYSIRNQTQPDLGWLEKYIVFQEVLVLCLIIQVWISSLLNSSCASVYILYSVLQNHTHRIGFLFFFNN